VAAQATQLQQELDAKSLQLRQATEKLEAYSREGEANKTLDDKDKSVLATAAWEEENETLPTSVRVRLSLLACLPAKRPMTPMIGHHRQHPPVHHVLDLQ
jgi:hypothetical protein